jgi:hypothetical protein
MTSVANLGKMVQIRPFDDPGNVGGGGVAYPLGGGGGGGGGSAEDGLGQIDSGASTVRGAISTAANALGGGGGGLPPGAVYKKGGKVTTTRMKPSMKRSEKCSNW